MRLVDTSAWIEWLAATSTGAVVRSHIPGPDEWLVPTIVQLELSKWCCRELGEDKADQVIAFTDNCVVAPLDTQIAIRAAEICVTHKLATADAVIYATSLAFAAELVTCDRHFKSLPGVIFIQKALHDYS